MTITEQEVRALVREAIERHMRRPLASPLAPRPLPLAPQPLPLTPHPSHVLLQVVAGSELDEGACVIEPAVRCTHCGFCRSYGH